jgi:Na+-driven multidrug efflux pump
LYTSRLVLKGLGVYDFGTYDVVAGVLVLFTFLNAAMSTATQRFLNVELGRNDAARMAKVFSVSVNVHFVIGLLIVLLAETVGYWIFTTKLIIPAERMEAAHWVYQFSIAATFINIMKVPYNASVIAHEKMSFFAVISVVSSLLHLGIAALLFLDLGDKLKLFAVLNCVITLFLFIAVFVYCRINFETAKYKYHKDFALFKELIGFSGWSLLSGFANAARAQGINIFLNMFHGVLLNAAMGIANQVSSAVYTFVTNFQVAFNPQIVKSYSAGNYDYFFKLVYKASKISFFLMLLFTLPLIINAEYVLWLWLGKVPEYSLPFLRLTLVFMLVESIGGPLWMSVQATGKIRNYQIVVSILVFMNLPLAYALLKIGANPAWVLVSRLIISLFILVWRVSYLRAKISLSAHTFLFKVIIPCVAVASIASIPPLALYSFIPGIYGFIISCAASVIASVLVIWFIGLASEERLYVSSLIKERMGRRKTIADKSP